MTDHKVGTREEWLAARRELLAGEKEHTRRGDELARRRRELPWVPVEKEYSFDTEAGRKSLAELFDGRSQLIVYHFMFGPDYEAGCPACSSIADGFNGFVPHLAHRAGVTMLCVSRTPLEKLLAYRERMGWTFPWVSSHGGDFNYDFAASFRPEALREGGEYNFEPFADRTPALEAGAVIESAERSGTSPEEYLQEAPGMSAFALSDEVVYHTYSAYARGLDGLWGAYQWLDRAPLGRNEEASITWQRRDEYESATAA
ncbi:MAG: DUF899 domain-containing protein [Solirubrobacteraceae bacterium]|jgi:predicted dithiol-disulfide oxidoreductase (DUF899 family)